MTTSPLVSPLHSFNLDQGGRLVDFGGWQMPVQYDSVLAEHRAVRETVGFFDVSHLGRFELTGAGAASAISGLLCNNLERIEPGRAQYTMMLNEGGGVVDDIIVWWWEPGRYWVMPNAVNQPRVMAGFTSQPDCQVEDIQATTAMIAIQGPEAPGLIESMFGEAPGRFRTKRLIWNGLEVSMAGTGYTGERGVELVVDPETGMRIARQLVDIGVQPCGLGARDTLRLEAGFPLWGQELDEGVTPIEAGLEFAIDLNHDFTGKSVLQDQTMHGVDKRLVGFVLDGKGVPRPGYPVRAGRSIGAVTSGNMSPTLSKGIAMSYLSPPVSDGPIEVNIRDRWVPGTIRKPPFISAG